MSDLRLLEFQIEHTRKAIDRDLADLAFKSMSAYERKGVREHLQFNIDALKHLKAQRERFIRDASGKIVFSSHG